MRTLFFLVFFVLTMFAGSNIAHAESPNVFLSVPYGVVAEGESFYVDVRVRAESAPVNAISGDFSFDQELVSAVSISKEKSIINFWVQEPKVQQNKIVFEGVVLNPGFEGTNGLVFRVNFKAKRTGTAFLNFGKGTVLAHDGLGTNTNAKFSSASFNIVKGTIPTVPKEAPDDVTVPYVEAPANIVTPVALATSARDYSFLLYVLITLHIILIAVVLSIFLVSRRKRRGNK